MENSSKEEGNGQESVPVDDNFNYDTFLEQIGQMGKFQLRSYILLCFPALFFGPIIMIYVFIGAIPQYRCHLEACEDAKTTDFEPSWLNRTIPWSHPDQYHRQCRQYNISWSNATQCRLEEFDTSSVTNCRGSVYDTSQFLSTIVTEFQLTCDDEWKQTLISTLFMTGMLVGAATLGHLADAVGRKYTFLGITFVMATAMTASAFTQDFVTFAVLRFVCGITSNGFFLVLFVWGIEAVGKKYRVLCGFIYNIATSIGSILLGIAAYYVREWRTLQLIVGAPLFLFVFLPMILPESTRWLISKNRYAEAKALILEAAKMNNKSTSSDSFEIKENNSFVETKQKSSETIVDVFKSKVLRKRIFIMFGVWMVTTMGYYGIIYSITNLSGDFYLSYSLAMVTEIPSGIAGIYSIRIFGHRTTLSGGLILGGIACLITGLVPVDPPALRIAFSIIGKFFITCILAVNYSYTIELFPTTTRNTVVGLCATMDKIGGIFAPILAGIGRLIGNSVPYIIFGSVNICIGSLALMLPETSKSQLPSNIQEAEDMEKYTITRQDFKSLKTRFVGKLNKT